MKIGKQLFIFLSLVLTSCSFNPFVSDHHLTGTAAGTIAGAGVGAGGAALLGAPKSVIIPAGLIGGMIGYYVTTLQFEASGITNAGGQVFKIGDYVGIFLPTDCLFESNTANLLPQSAAILDSVVAVLKRYPDDNIIISGNTSGFYCARWEQMLSEKRAQKVAAYLWKSGINNFEEGGPIIRKLSYVGYGNYFPLSSSDSINKGIRSNSRIQITVYPSTSEIGLTGREVAYNNVGSMSDG